MPCPRTRAPAFAASPGDTRSRANAGPCRVARRLLSSASWSATSWLGKCLALEFANLRNGPAVYGLPVRDAHPDRLRAALRLPRFIFPEILLDCKPVRTPPARIKQDE